MKWMVGFLGVVTIACGARQAESEVPASSLGSGSSVSVATTAVDNDAVEPTTAPTTVLADEAVEGVVALPVGKLVFDSDRSGNLDLYLLEQGSTAPVQLTEDAGSDRDGRFTPDGEAVLFSSDRAGGPDSPTGLRRFDLYRLDLASKEEQHLLGSRTYNSSPMLSPDGDTLGFASDASGENHIYLADSDGSSPQQLTQENTSNGGPVWSPDGSQIAYSARGEESWNVWIMDGDGNNRRPLVEGPDDAYAPTWSPDGRYIAFDSDRHADEPDIYMLHVEDGAVSRLTDDPGRDAFPDWGP